jgi:hypothetical protein
MLLYIFSDSFMGLRFATMILKAGKLDMCEVIGLMVAALNFVSGLRYVEDHRLPCSFGHKRCVRTFGFGQDYLGMIWRRLLCYMIDILFFSLSVLFS